MPLEASSSGWVGDYVCEWCRVRVYLIKRKVIDKERVTNHDCSLLQINQ